MLLQWFPRLAALGLTENQIFLLLNGGFGLLGLVIVFMFMPEPREAFLDRDCWRFPSVIATVIFILCALGFGLLFLLLAIGEVWWDYNSRRKEKS